MVTIGIYLDIPHGTVGILLYCNTAVRGLTDIYARFPRVTVLEEECGYISKTLSMAVLQHLCNIFKSIITLLVFVKIEKSLSVRYYMQQN